MIGKHIGVVAAYDDGGVIGNEGRLPWNIRAELKHFRHITYDATIVMGYKTWESIFWSCFAWKRNNSSLES
ncbi:MAG: dihydrofolate reductase [Candidatus Woesearchaeota archaeon]|jgi:dihydrofolate reductase